MGLPNSAFRINEMPGVATSGISHLFTMDRWNGAKRAEERDRVKHG